MIDTIQKSPPDELCQDTARQFRADVLRGLALRRSNCRASISTTRSVRPCSIRSRSSTSITQCAPS